MKRIGLLFLVMILIFGGGNLWAAGGAARSSAGSQETPVLDYWLPIIVLAAKHLKDLGENQVYQKIQENLNIKVNFIHPTSYSETEQFNLMIASGDLPDMIQGANRYQGGVIQGVHDGVYVELSPHLQNKAPDYYKIINENADMRRQFYDEEGRIGAFYKVSPWPPAPPYHRAITRKDWLEEFNMKPPMTFAEYEAFFDAILVRKPGVTPFFLPSGGQGMNDMYGAFNLAPDWFQTNGKARHGKADPELLNYVTKMNEWYRKGYISKDWAFLNLPQYWAAFDTGQAAMYFDSVDSSGARGANLSFEMENCPLPRPAADSKLHLVGSPYRRSGDETAITVAAEKRGKLDTALKFLNYGYSTEGAMLYNWGIEGWSYNLVNGKPVYTDLVTKSTLYDADTCNYIYRIHFAPKMGISDTVANPAVVGDAKKLAFRMQWSDDPNTDGLYRLPPIALTAAENTRRAEIMANVNTYADEMILKFIMGTEPLSNFNRYMDQLNQYGMQEAINITQTALDRYMAKR